jgi:acyl carrier protein
LNLIRDSDWPRIRRLIAKRLKISEAEVQAMLDRGDSLDQVELVMIVEELGEE